MKKYCNNCKALVNLSKDGYCTNCGEDSDNMDPYTVSIDTASGESISMTNLVVFNKPDIQLIDKTPLLEKARQMAKEQEANMKRAMPDYWVDKGILIGINRIIGLIERT